uniref:Uncharacterized protein n=1 Tax=Siphoviridae sp. ctXPh6 TaxID=2827578 RepID=A0A8S5LK86_9CAUD|nr:MAG TPA: hypothetical protein [Siphoviridae sp. ctXPh6]
MIKKDFEVESEEMKEAMKKVEETRIEYLQALHDLGKLVYEDGEKLVLVRKEK